MTLTDPDSGETTDAVQVELDHADADAVDIFVPYETEGEGIKFGELVAAEGREPVFAHAASSAHPRLRTASSAPARAAGAARAW